MISYREKPKGSTKKKLLGLVNWFRKVSKHIINKQKSIFVYGIRKCSSFILSPAQAGCTREVLGPGALGRPRGIG